MNRNDFRALARVRLREARVLLRSGCFEGAYYLAGYVVECALKACVAKQTKRYDFPDKQTAFDSHVHDLRALLKVAKLQTAHDQEIRSDPAFERHWKVIAGWKEVSRYHPTVLRTDAEQLLKAVADPQHGVLRWLRRHW